MESVPWWPVLNVSDVTTDSRGLFLYSVTSAAQCGCLLWTDEAVDGLNRSQPPPGAKKLHTITPFRLGVVVAVDTGQKTPADVCLFCL